MEQYKLVGIFTTCLHHNHNKNDSGGHRKQHQRNISTFDTEESYRISQSFGVPSNQLFVYDYVTYHVCSDDTDGLLTVLTRLLLNETFFFKRDGASESTTMRRDDRLNEPNIMSERRRVQVNETNINSKRDGEDARQDSKILLLVAHVSGEMSKLIEEMLSFTVFPRVCRPVPCDRRLKRLTEDDKVAQLLKLFEKFKWYNVNVLSVLDPILYDYRDYQQTVYSALNATQRFCLSRKELSLSITMNREIYREHIRPFLQNRSDSVTLIFSSFHVQDIISRLAKDEFAHKVIIYNEYKPRSGMFNWIETDTWLIVYSSLQGKQYQDQLSDKGYFQYVIETYSLVMLLDSNFKQKKFREALHSSINEMHSLAVYSYVIPFSAEMFRRPQLPQLFLDTDLYEAESDKFLRSAVYKSQHCPETICTAGHESAYGAFRYNNESNIFDYGMRCMRCSDDHIKVGLGDGPCIRCTGLLNIADETRTRCVDPYTNVYSTIRKLQFYIMLTLSLIGVVLTSFIFIVFVLKRNTVRVKLSDFTLTSLHLTTMITIFATSFYVYRESRRSISFCVARNLILSILYTLNTALVYTKSEKLLVAFQSKVQVTHHEMQKTVAGQVFTMVTLVLVANGILCVLYYQQPPGFDFVLMHGGKKMQRVHYCNTELHQKYLIAFLLVVQLVCLVQAFRGRNLPSAMNDALSMVYAILITTLAFTVYFPISYFQSTVDSEFLQFMVIAINSICFVLFLYGGKCFIIIFKSHKNTRSYLNTQLMKNSARQVSYHGNTS